MQPQSALVGADCRVELDAETAVDLHLAVIVHPADTEGNKALRLDDTLKHACVDQILPLFGDRLQGFQYFIDGLQKFLFARVAHRDGFVYALQILIRNGHGL